MKCLFVILFAACVAVVLADNNLTGEEHEVTAPIGRIRGSIIISRLGKKIYCFRGVRYAEPPTGQQRFQVKILSAGLRSNIINYNCILLSTLFFFRLCRDVIILHW